MELGEASEAAHWQRGRTWKVVGWRQLSETARHRSTASSNPCHKHRACMMSMARATTCLGGGEACTQIAEEITAGGLAMVHANNLPRHPPMPTCGER